ncbi:HDOD domain-containing protein [Accumulibacter sp.]|uniref:HDOD domain-containing protein n=1 Tax=Accumulibacter sp. TaxID=2053492 RepID=UPI0025DC20F0|nr:HDOD domain-containing protein [Accumulibacter sp.]MCM8593825.1 HDOD domain-containing protein [Accumulibacter sp.]MCM8626133.1 HDOD domain-containing protein [Accumulibacter sp.]MDS4047966.1 HDOD domain-containing protein [Accumulibacter sp.]
MVDQKARMDVGGWLLSLDRESIPVLRQTARRLDEVRRNVARIGGREIAGIVQQDPLLAARVLASIQTAVPGRLRSDITSVTSAVMLIGVEPFLRRFADLPTVEGLFGGQRPALLSALQLILRAQRASRYAHEWAIHRYDLNAEEVALAALLHDLAEILLGCLAPELMTEVRRRQRDWDRSRGERAEQQVLGLRLAELQLALCQAWHLPELLITLIDERNAEHARARVVHYAVRFARHSISGWTEPNLGEDLEAVERLLNLGREALIDRLALPAELVPGLLGEARTAARSTPRQKL